MTTPLALITEDEAALRVIYERVLRSLGFEVLHARDGGQAIEILNEHVPDLLVLDMLMPMVNGEAVLKHIAGQPRLVNMHIVIASSAKEYEVYTQTFVSCEFLLKPLSAQQIREIGMRVLTTRAT